MDQPTAFISYIRVSTERQGKSGLGLEAQKTVVDAFVTQSGGKLIEEYVEVESGKRNSRSQLKAAIDACKRQKATLIIAKLDRLARNVHFISGLIETGVPFRAADMPNADKFMLHVYAAMAEEEGRRISERTKHALQAAKRRGVRLGVSCKQLAAKKVDEANDHSRAIGPIIEALKAEGMSVRKIVDRLNSDNITSYSGGKWHPTTVQRSWQRYAELNLSTTGKFTNPPC
ncbi:recombinase family protein [Sulfitobacter guttiformis]|uniref:DNA invertase Pin-like site-specific DNA recombinase n=1 Tax=Sulfitobacter guttiformis TaxID=74349 RepID=A0A420DHE4_9RHOB|nr:recombinase family protein [Sulfitobacter guttiformis]KIN72642.1 Site-specific recombinase [Sulfitobacter guttiformis KCTC 32187]RKE93630.1 DNA invertase Pin-like site-specific DNA recombinase [Sulfitobacter guttiformis]